MSDPTGVFTDDELEQMLSAEYDPADDRPARVPHHAGVGNSPTVPRDEQRRRRRVMSELLAMGWELDQLVTHFSLPPTKQYQDGTPGFGLSENGVRHLIQIVLDAWKADDALLGPYKKQIAERRTLQEIRAARVKGQYTAVASLEKNLIAIQGTAAPVRVEHQHRLTGAIISVLGEMGEDELESLISTEVRRDGARLRAPREVIDATPEPGATRVALPPPRE